MYRVASCTVTILFSKRLYRFRFCAHNRYTRYIPKIVISAHIGFCHDAVWNLRHSWCLYLRARRLRAFRNTFLYIKKLLSIFRYSSPFVVSHTLSTGCAQIACSSILSKIYNIICIFRVFEIKTRANYIVLFELYKNTHLIKNICKKKNITIYFYIS